MVLGAFVDSGMPLEHLRRQLTALHIGQYKIERAKAKREISGTNIHVEIESEHSHRDYKQIDEMIARCKLNKGVKETARAIFEKLAIAEARVHGIAVSKVHFHEVGSADSIIDVVGAAIGLDYFGFDAVYSSPLPITRGKVKCAHGTLPVPAPATLELIKGVPLEPSKVKEEIVTPTGAAIITTIAEHFGECPIQTVKSVGYGFGDKIIPGMPNALRLIIGDGFPVVVIQSDIDDMNPQLFDNVIGLLLSAGAADVDLAPIQKKKNRPAVRLTALSPWEKKDAIIDLILKETTTFGVRYWPVERRVLTRKLVEKRVKGKLIHFKLGIDSRGKVIKAVPEYEDVKKLAKQTHKPLIEIYRSALLDAEKFIKP